jgi:hypothetical protein
MTRVTSSPMLKAATNDELSVAEWQARARLDIAVLIERYLTENPPPAGSRHAGLYSAWAAGLRAAGEAHLAELQAHRLRVV